jgi:hypothetical protein
VRWQLQLPCLLYTYSYIRAYTPRGRRPGRLSGIRTPGLPGPQGREEGREQGREEGLRRAIVEVVCARLPGLRDELEDGLRGQPEARLVQLAAELGKAQDEAEVRAILGQRS